MESLDQPVQFVNSTEEISRIPSIVASPSSENHYKNERVPTGVVEISPYRRYIRFNEIIGDGLPGGVATSFRAFDTTNAIEVDWHIVELIESVTSHDSDRMKSFADELKNIQDVHIQNIQNTWLITESMKLNIITSHLPSLKEFMRKKGMALRWKVVKKWCTRILRGLECLHNSRIVHRNLSCSDIYINSGTGDLCIGNTWLSAMLGDTPDQCVSFTEPTAVLQHAHVYHTFPYLAPEMFDNSPLTTSVDIYSFGICTLEIITREDPYRECHGSIGRVAYRAKHGIPPMSLPSVTHPLARDFIELCLAPDRPTATELLRHPFLSKQETDEEINIGTSTSDTHVGETSFPEGTDIAIVEGETEFVEAFEQRMKEFAMNSYVSSESVSSADTTSPSHRLVLDLDYLPHHESDMMQEETITHIVQIANSEVTITTAYETTEGSNRAAKDSVEEGEAEESSPGRLQQTSTSSRNRNMLLETDPVNLNFRRSTSNMMDRPPAYSPRGHHRSNSGDDSKPRASRNMIKGPHMHSLTLPLSALSSTLMSPLIREYADGRDRIEVRLQIPKNYSKDGQMKEVEFIFNRLKDRYEVVAGEMIDELELTVSVQELAEKIEEKVKLARNKTKAEEGSNSLSGDVEHLASHRVRAASVDSTITRSPVKMPLASTALCESVEKEVEVKMDSSEMEREASQSQLETAGGAESSARDTSASKGPAVEDVVILSTSLSTADKEPSSHIADDDPGGATQTTSVAVVSVSMSVSNALDNTDAQSVSGDVIVSREGGPSDSYQPSVSPALSLDVEDTDQGEVSSFCVLATSSESTCLDPGLLDIRSRPRAAEPIASSGSVMPPVDQQSSKAEVTLSPPSIVDKAPSSESIDTSEGVLRERIAASFVQNKIESSVAPSLVISVASSIPLLSSIGPDISDRLECVTPSGTHSPVIPRSPQISRRGTELQLDRLDPVDTASARHASDETEDAEDMEYKREKERIEKESRVSRRTYEQRIQKHKNILEKCDEDMQKADNEHTLKSAEMEKKKDTANKKKEEDLNKLYEEYSAKKQLYFDKKRLKKTEMSQRKQEQSEAVRVHQTVSSPNPGSDGGYPSPPMIMQNIQGMLGNTPNMSISNTPSLPGPGSGPASGNHFWAHATQGIPPWSLTSSPNVNNSTSPSTSMLTMANLSGNNYDHTTSTRPFSSGGNNPSLPMVQSPSNLSFDQSINSIAYSSSGGSTVSGKQTLSLPPS